MADLFTEQIPEEEYFSVPRYPLGEFKTESDIEDDQYVFDVAKFLVDKYGTIMLVDKSTETLGDTRFVTNYDQGRGYLMINGSKVVKIIDSKSQPGYLGYFMTDFRAEFFRIPDATADSDYDSDNEDPFHLIHCRYTKKVGESEYSGVPKDETGDRRSYQVACFLAQKYGSIMMEDAVTDDTSDFAIIIYNQDGSYDLIDYSYSSDYSPIAKVYSKMEEMPEYQQHHMISGETRFFRCL